MSTVSTLDDASSSTARPQRGSSSRGGGVVCWVVGWGAFLAALLLYILLLSAYDGWLGWDDSSHCVVSLSRLREAREHSYPLGVAFFERYSHEAPRPPLTSMVFSAVLMLFPKEQFLWALYTMLFGMILLQGVLVWWLACRWASPWAAAWSLICLLGSTVNVSMALRLIAEIPLSILYLLITWIYVREIRRPSWHLEVAVGLLIGLAMLAKQTAPFTFGIGMLIVVGVLLKRGQYAEAVRGGCLSFIGALTTSLWWYIPNMTPIIEYVKLALSTDGYLAGDNPYDLLTRLWVYVLVTWGPITTLAWFYLVPWFRTGPVEDRSLERNWFATIGLATTAVVVLLSLRVHHYEPRYFHATFPVLAVIAGFVLEQIGRRARWWGRVAVGLVAIVSTWFVANLMVEEPKSYTDWSGITFLNDLDQSRGEAFSSFALVGNNGDWSDNKWRLLNELSDRPKQHSFMLFTSPPPLQIPRWKEELLRYDFVLVLKQLRPQLHQAYAMDSLNIDYEEIKAFVESSPNRFERVPNDRLVVPADYILYRTINAP